MQPPFQILEARAGPRNADLISDCGILYVYTYDCMRVHAISRSCPHLHAAVIIRTGLRGDALRVIPVFSSWAWPRGENRARDRSPALFIFLPPVVFCRLLVFPAPVRSRWINAYIQLPRQNQPGSLRLERWQPFILIHAGDLSSVNDKHDPFAVESDNPAG